MGRDGGFLIGVKNSTTLLGSVIASSDRAVADGVNKLTTGTLVAQDLKNTAKYSCSRVSIGGGFGFAGSAKAGDSGPPKPIDKCRRGKRGLGMQKRRRF